MSVVVFTEEVAATVVLSVWVILVAEVLTRRLYGYMIGRSVQHYVSVYYNRKIIHILTGGVVAVLAPYIFRTPILPFIMALLLAIFLYIPHKRRKLMYWFQTEENAYEVSFCVLWGVIIAFGWIVSNGNFWFGILPVIFMSIGDAVTGFVRNMLYKRRTKSWRATLQWLPFQYRLERQC